MPFLAGDWTPVGITWHVPGEEVLVHLLHLCFLAFCLQSFRGKKASGLITKASNYTTPLMNLRAKVSIRTPKVRSAPDCGRASCPRTTTGPPTSTTSHGSGTGSPSQLWQVRSQWPRSEGAADPHSVLTFGKGGMGTGPSCSGKPWGFI